MDDDINPNHLFIGMRHVFKATRVIGQRLTPATIKVKLDMSTMDDETDEYSTKMELALEKIDYWINKVVNNSIIIDAKNEWAMNSFMTLTQPMTTNNVLLLPEEPTDSTLCEVLLCKIQALAQDAFTFHSIEIESTDARGMSFLFVGGNPGESFPTEEEWLGTHNYFSRPWWHRDDASSIDIVPDEDADLLSPPQWAYSLGFIIDRITGGETIPNNVVVRPEFRPKVIEGGKVD